MINLSMAQALGLWEELVEAYHGKNGFGGDTADLYLYRFMPCSPMAEYNRHGEAAVSRICTATRSLHALLAHFIAMHDGIRLTVDGRRFGKWVAVAGHDHRVHVRVIHKRLRTNARPV